MNSLETKTRVKNPKIKQLHANADAHSVLLACISTHTHSLHKHTQCECIIHCNTSLCWRSEHKCRRTSAHCLNKTLRLSWRIFIVHHLYSAFLCSQVPCSKLCRHFQHQFLTRLNNCCESFFFFFFFFKNPFLLIGFHNSSLAVPFKSHLMQAPNTSTALYKNQTQNFQFFNFLTRQTTGMMNAHTEWGKQVRCGSIFRLDQQ